MALQITLYTFQTFIIPRECKDVEKYHSKLMKNEAMEIVKLMKNINAH